MYIIYCIHLEIKLMELWPIGSWISFSSAKVKSTTSYSRTYHQGLPQHSSLPTSLPASCNKKKECTVPFRKSQQRQWRERGRERREKRGGGAITPFPVPLFHIYIVHIVNSYVCGGYSFSRPSPLLPPLSIPPPVMWGRHSKILSNA